MFVIGVSGVTNGGKSSLCRSLAKLFPRSTYLCQDTFFHKRVSGKLEYRSDLQSHNYDCIEAIDSELFFVDLEEIMALSENYDFLFIDGFLLFHFHTKIRFDKKFFFTLTMGQCLEKRLKRNYKTVGSLEYFHQLVWPCYTKYRDFCMHQFDDIFYLDGSEPSEKSLHLVSQELVQLLGTSSLNNQ